MRTPIDVYEVKRIPDEYGITREKAIRMQDVPAMVHGTPGSPEAKDAARVMLEEMGFKTRTINHAPGGKLLAYVVKGDAPAPLAPPVRPQRSAVPRKVR